MRLRWPNDLYLDGGKLGGVLCEGSFQGGEPHAFVAGVGLNVGQRLDDLPDAVRTRAASLERSELDPVDVGIAVVKRAIIWWSSEREAIVARFRELSEGSSGSRVLVRPVSGDPYRAETLGIDEGGGLRVRGPDDELSVLRADDVELLAEPDFEDDSYFSAVESYFVERRGSPLFITPAEWALIAKWEASGVPLRAVQEGIDRALERPGRPGRPRKLSYCRQAVEAAARRYREARFGAADGEVSEPDTFDPESSTASLADALGPERAALAERVTALGRSGKPPDELERELARLDEEMIGEAEDSLDASDREALLGEASASLAAYRERMPDKVYEQAVRSAYRRRLRSRLGLPLLTLYE